MSCDQCRFRRVNRAVGRLLECQTGYVHLGVLVNDWQQLSPTLSKMNGGCDMGLQLLMSQWDFYEVFAKA